jgi:hypothetical protein
MGRDPRRTAHPVADVEAVALPAALDDVALAVVPVAQTIAASDAVEAIGAVVDGVGQRTGLGPPVTWLYVMLSSAS